MPAECRPGPAQPLPRGRAPSSVGRSAAPDRQPIRRERGTGCLAACSAPRRRRVFVISRPTPFASSPIRCACLSRRAVPAAAGCGGGPLRSSSSTVSQQKSLCRNLHRPGATTVLPVLAPRGSGAGLGGVRDAQGARWSSPPVDATPGPVCWGLGPGLCARPCQLLDNRGKGALGSVGMAGPAWPVDVQTWELGVAQTYVQ